MIYSVRSRFGGFDLYDDGSSGPPRPVPRRSGAPQTMSQLLAAVPPGSRPAGHSAGPVGTIAVFRGLGQEPPAASAPATAPAPSVPAGPTVQQPDGFWSNTPLVFGVILGGTYLYYKALTALSKELF